jgi:hypothetical protein
MVLMVHVMSEIIVFDGNGRRIVVGTRVHVKRWSVLIRVMRQGTGMESRSHARSVLW